MLTINGIPLQSSFTFPGGEVQIKLPLDELPHPSDSESRLHIKTILNSSERIMELMMVKAALDSHYGLWTKKDLSILYFPFARQDRVCVKGEANASKVFIDMLQWMRFDTIFVADVHNTKIFNEIDGRFYLSTGPYMPVEHMSVKDIFSKNVDKLGLDDINYLIAPDDGAYGKVYNLAVAQDKGFLHAKKIRNPEDGKIESIMLIDGHLCEGKDVMIVDDICDGGATFIGLAKEILQFKPKSITLYVTHGIFSKGIDILLRGGIDKVITTDSFFDPDHYHKFLSGWGFGESSVEYLKLQGKFEVIGI